MEPAARAVNFLAHELGQDQEEDAAHIHRQSAPPDPPVVHQAGEHEGKKTDDHPVGLLAPEIRRHRIFAHIGCAVDGNHAKDRQGEHEDEQEPVEAEQFPQKWSHVRSTLACLKRVDFEYTQPAKIATRFAASTWKNPALKHS